MFNVGPRLLSVFVSSCLMCSLLSSCAKAAPPGPSAPMEEGAAEPAKQSADTQNADVPTSPMIIKEAQIELSMDHPEELLAHSAGVAQASGGFVVNTDVDVTRGVATRAEVSLRVPTARFDEALGNVRQAGALLKESVTGQDVTADFVDLSARLRSKQTMEQRLLAMLTSSADVEDLLKVESTLAEVRSDVERLSGQRKLLKHRADLSLIRVVAFSPTQPRVASTQSFWSRLGGAFSAAGEHAQDVAVGSVTVLGFLLPLGLAVALVLSPVLWLHRRRRRAASTAAAVAPAQ